MSYKVFRNCPMVLKLLGRPLRASWKTQSIPSAWCRAITTFIPKEKDFQNISQFRGIALLNVEGKLFFTVVARCMASNFLSNNYFERLQHMV